MINDMFKGLAEAKTSTRIPNPKVGEGDFLLNSMRMQESREGKKFVKLILTCLRCTSEEGNIKGDKVSVAVFAGDYFLKELKGFLLSLTNTDASDEAELVEGLKAQFGVDSAEEAWGELAQAAMAIGPDGKEIAAGLFDNQAIIRINTKVKEAKPTGKYVKGPDGDMIPEMGNDFINHYPQGGVLLADLADELEEKDIERFFGSEEKFAELLEEESA